LGERSLGSAAVVTTAAVEPEPPGLTGSGRVARQSPGDPGQVQRHQLDLFSGAPSAPTRRGRTTIMAAKPKPPQSDEAREAARRALQTSMDTRQ
jgi:hypothetical protein